MKIQSLYMVTMPKLLFVLSVFLLVFDSLFLLSLVLRGHLTEKRPFLADCTNCLIFDAYTQYNISFSNLSQIDRMFNNRNQFIIITFSSLLFFIGASPGFRFEKQIRFIILVSHAFFSHSGSFYSSVVPPPCL